MPPFRGNGTKSVPGHGAAQQHAVGILRFGDAGIPRMAELSKEIKGPAHIQIGSGFHIKKRQIHRAAPAMVGARGDIALRNNLSLFQGGIEESLHPGIGLILRPAHKMLHSHLGTIGIIDFQAISLADHFIADLLQRGSRFAGEQRNRLFIAIDPVADEIEGGIVADFQDHVGNGFAEDHKS